MRRVCRNEGGEGRGLNVSNCPQMSLNRAVFEQIKQVFTVLEVATKKHS